VHYAPTLKDGLHLQILQCDSCCDRVAANVNGLRYLQRFSHDFTAICKKTNVFHQCMCFLQNDKRAQDVLSLFLQNRCDNFEHVQNHCDYNCQLNHSDNRVRIALQNLRV